MLHGKISATWKRAVKILHREIFSLVPVETLSLFATVARQNATSRWVPSRSSPPRPSLQPPPHLITRRNLFPISTWWGASRRSPNRPPLRTRRGAERRAGRRTSTRSGRSTTRTGPPSFRPSAQFLLMVGALTHFVLNYSQLNIFFASGMFHLYP